MPEPSKMDMEAKQYFNSLPPALQEQLMQSAADLNTKEDLMRYCTNLLGEHALDRQPGDRNGRGRAAAFGFSEGLQSLWGGFFVPQALPGPQQERHCGGGRCQ